MSSLSERAAQVAAGISHSLILTESGKALACGNNAKGQLGNGNTHSSSVPVEVSAPGLRFKSLHASGFSAGITDIGDLYLWGQNPSFGESLTPTKEIKLRNVVSVGLGAHFVAVVDSQGSVYTWGAGQQGELGLGSYETTEEPEQVGQLEAKQATQISTGNSHVIALGQNVYPSSRSTPVPQQGLNAQMSQASGMNAQMSQASGMNVQMSQASGLGQ